MKFLVIFVLALVATVFAFPDFGANCNCGTKEAYVLALSQCKSQPFPTIHGLWPQWQMNCGNTFDIKQVEPIRSELNKFWPSCPEISKRTSAEFWEYEYNKHGSCMKNITQLDYFQLTLDVRERHYATCGKFNGECRLCLDGGMNIIKRCQ